MRTASATTSPKNRAIGARVTAERNRRKEAGLCIYCPASDIQPATDGHGCGPCKAYNLGATRAKRLAMVGA